MVAFSRDTGFVVAMHRAMAPCWRLGRHVVGWVVWYCATTACVTMSCSAACVVLNCDAMGCGVMCGRAARRGVVWRVLHGVYGVLYVAWRVLIGVFLAAHGLHCDHQTIVVWRV